MSAIAPYLRLMRLHRPIGSLLLLWPTWWALWLAAEGWPGWHLFSVFTLGVVLMRSGGCAINDYFDRDFDGRVARTRERPLATGELPASHAPILFVGLALVSFGLVLTLNSLAIGLSFVGALLAATYPLLKRYTYLPQIYLGIAFGWGIPMAFAATTGSLPPLCWLLFTANLLWTTAYDSLYAMVDRDDDLTIGIRSTAILFGQDDRLFIGILQIGSLIGFFLVGHRAELGLWFLLALVISGGLFLWQQWLIRKRDRDGCFRAFLNNNAVGAALFSGLLLHYLSRP
ncbi:MAG: 4-hydroxybenzoate octaprenyltransferase [Gammaproteobacteria bacterium]|nr:4-hydroxybenzoate octaprenyltransferase [Gammaproteobacteria bacterium]